MKILVCISKAPDTTSKIAFTDNNTKFDENGIQFIVNPYDEWYALVRGLELKETLGGSVTTITVGTADHDPIIRKALAIGADNAVRIDMNPKDAYSTAEQIANYAKEGGFDIILTGKETINFNSSQVAGIISGIMDIAYVSLATKLDVNGTTATLARDIVGGEEIVEAQLPIVISAAKGMAEQRIPNMRGIMAARTKALEVIAPSGDNALSHDVDYSLPPAKSACKMIDADNVQELVNLLQNEAKAI